VKISPLFYGNKKIMMPPGWRYINTENSSPTPQFADNSKYVFQKVDEVSQPVGLNGPLTEICKAYDIPNGFAVVDYDRSPEQCGGTDCNTYKIQYYQNLENGKQLEVCKESKNTLPSYWKFVKEVYNPSKCNCSNAGTSPNVFVYVREALAARQEDLTPGLKKLPAQKDKLQAEDKNAGQRNGLNAIAGNWSFKDLKLTPAPASFAKGQRVNFTIDIINSDVSFNGSISLEAGGVSIGKLDEVKIGPNERVSKQITGSFTVPQSAGDNLYFSMKATSAGRSAVWNDKYEASCVTRLGTTSCVYRFKSHTRIPG
jgi:hypothetical protein